MKRLGIALGADRLVAALPGGRRLETADVADLSRAFADLQRAAGLPWARVTVALLPPLVDVRRLSLPPLKADEFRRVVTRDVARYFVAAREPQLLAAAPPFVAAAATSVVAAIEAAVMAVGWTLHAIVPAHVVWAAAAREGRVVAHLREASEILDVAGGQLRERRRLRGAESLGDAKEIEPFVVAAEAAARFRGSNLDLQSDERRTSRARAERRVAQTLIAAALGCLILAAGIDYWGLRHELRVIESRRAAIASSVGRALAGHDSLAMLATVSTRVRAVEAGNHAWSTFFADLSDYLPRDGHLEAFRAVGDSVSLVGVASDAAAAFQSLARMPHLSAVRPDGAIRQDVSAAGVVREHFGLSARWGDGSP